MNIRKGRQPGNEASAPGFCLMFSPTGHSVARCMDKSVVYRVFDVYVGNYNMSNSSFYRHNLA